MMTADPGPSPPPRDPAAPAGPPLEQRFDAGSLYALRAAVSAHAAAAGLSKQRVYDVTAAVHELAANAVLHGAGHGRVRLWTQDGFLHCQVSDAGPARREDSGTLPRAVPWPAEHGHGLWIVAQVTDKSAIDHGPAGTTVTTRFALSPARRLAAAERTSPERADASGATSAADCQVRRMRWPMNRRSSASPHSCSVGPRRSPGAAGDAPNATASAASSLHQILAVHEVPGHRSRAAAWHADGTVRPHAATQAARSQDPRNDASDAILPICARLAAPCLRPCSRTGGSPARAVSMAARIPACRLQRYVGHHRDGRLAEAAPGTPASLARELPRLAAQLFSYGYINAMRWTMPLPITIVTLAAVSALAIRPAHGRA
jgi:anti-sigma regulatory factor (Ser/Thr protein kinase)